MARNPRIDAVRAVFDGDSREPEVLKLVLVLAEELYDAVDIPALTELAGLCADASREEEWRGPLVASRLVYLFQSILASSVKSTEIRISALRLIGNSCADNDKNRQHVIEHPEGLVPVIEALRFRELRKIGPVVLNNICLDYEPSQRKAISDGAVSVILEVIGGPGFTEELGYFLRILELLVSVDNGKSAFSECTINTLLDLAISPETSFDDRLSVYAIISTLLSHHEFQTYLISRNLFPIFLTVLESTYIISPSSDSEKQDRKLISHARNALVENAGDVASLPEFLPRYPLEGKTVQRAVGWLQLGADGTGEKEDLIVAACLIIGNVGRSDEVCGLLVDWGVHNDLYAVIKATIKRFDDAKDRLRNKDGKDGEVSSGAMAVGVLHATAGVLKNLAIAKRNKTALGEGSFDVVEKMLAMNGVGVGQVWYTAVGLGRLIIVNNLENVKRFLSSPEIATNDTESEEDAPLPHSLLSVFMNTYKEAEEQPIKTEIARTIASVLRTLQTSTEVSKSDTDALQSKLFAHPNIAIPLWDMVKQDKWTAVRSEGLFALALMARSKLGAERAWKAWEENEGGSKEVDDILENAIAEEKDRDNVLVFLVELLDHITDQIDHSRRNALETLRDDMAKSKARVRDLTEMTRVVEIRDLDPFAS